MFAIIYNRTETKKGDQSPLFFRKDSYLYVLIAIPNEEAVSTVK